MGYAESLELSLPVEKRGQKIGVVRKFLQETMYEIDELMTRQAIGRPYSAPIDHPMPSIRYDVPSLIEPGTMNINPGFAVDINKREDVKEALENMRKKPTPFSVQKVFLLLEECIPEFHTQFSDQELEQLQRGDTQVIAKIEYAFGRIFTAMLTEDRLGWQNDVIQYWASDEILRHIPDQQIRQRLYDARILWDAMLRTPHRNFFLRVPDRYEDPLYADPFRTQEGKALAAMGPEHFSCILEKAEDTSKRKNEGSTNGVARLIEIAPHSSPMRCAVVVMHELIHMEQNNDLLRQDYELWERAMTNLRRTGLFIQRTNTQFAHLTREAEAYWADINLMYAMVQSRGGDVEKFCENEPDAEMANHVKWAIGIYEQFASSDGGNYQNPAFIEFMKNYLMQINNGNTVLFVDKEPGQLVAL